MNAFNDPALAAWRLYGDWGFKIVILGVIGEVCAAGIDFIAEKWCKQWHRKGKRSLRFAEFFSGAVLIFGLAMEYRGHKNETLILDSYNAQSYERASTNELTALALQKEVLRLKNPSEITSEQRQKFIEILSDGGNYSKTLVKVIDGDDVDRPTEIFAFKIRALLDEAGYGDKPSQYQLPKMEMPPEGIYISLHPPPLKLTPFDWIGAIVRKIPSLEVPALPVVTNATIFTTGAASAYNPAYPFTDKEPNIIAIFSGTIPTPDFSPTNAPSVFIGYPNENIPMRDTIYCYVPTKDPNAILYGLCEVFHDIGITVGVNTNNDILEPGQVGFFIPSR